MDPLAVSGLVFACILGGTVLGGILRAFLPDEHLSADSKDVIKLGMGLIGTMTALVLGLLIASAKNSYDTQRNGLAQLSANIIWLDRILAHYGTESRDVRALLRTSVADLLERTWPGENPQAEQTAVKGETVGRYEGIFDKIQELTPKNETQRALQTQALNTAWDTGRMRLLLYVQKGGSIPTPFLVLLVCWLALILASFSLFAPRNATALVTLLVCTLAVSSAVFLILELDQPFQGVLQIPSAPLRNALAQLGN